MASALTVLAQRMMAQRELEAQAQAAAGSMAVGQEPDSKRARTGGMLQSLSETAEQYAIRMGHASTGLQYSEGHTNLPDPNASGGQSSFDAAGATEAMQWLSMHQVEAHAAERFRGLSVEQQQSIMQRGTLLDARDQTAVLISRISKLCPPAAPTSNGIQLSAADLMQFARNQQRREGRTQRPEISDTTFLDKDAWLAMHQVEAHALAKFLALQPDAQQLVMRKGDLLDARDQTAVLISRMKALEPPDSGDWLCPSCGDQQFRKNTQCRVCGCGRPVGEALVACSVASARALGVHVQQHQAKKAPLLAVPDPRAVLMSRIAAGQSNYCGPAAPIGDGSAGDWLCPGCGDLQFRRNQQCRICRTPRPQDSSSSAATGFLDPIMWLSMHQVEAQAAAQFVALQPDAQQQVMQKGDLLDARDQTAVLVSRMQALGPPESGDWLCPSCGDQQFRRNTQCRVCGCARPVGEALTACSLAPAQYGQASPANMQGGSAKLTLMQLAMLGGRRQ